MSKPMLLNNQITLLAFAEAVTGVLDIGSKESFVNTIIGIFFEKKFIVEESLNDLGEDALR